MGNLGATTVPPASDPYFQYVSLLVGFDGTNGQTTFTDESPVAQAVSVFGAAQVDTAIKKFGTGSLKCAVAGTDYVQVPDNVVFTMGNGDFTMELWWQPQATGSHYIMGQGSSGGFAWNGLAIESNSQRWLQRDFVEVYETTSAFTPTLGQWYYLVMERSGSIARLYRDGIMVRKVTIGAGALTDATDPWRMGLFWPGNGTQAHLDEVRVTKGIARYNSDAGTPVPTAEFPRGGPPWFLSGPTATGNTWVGQILTANETDNATSRAYQWKRGGTPISGATAVTYTLVSGDIGSTITCTVTLTSVYGTSNATTAAVGPITATDPLASIRGSRLLYVNNSGTGTLTLPTGSVAGDRMVVCAGHGYGVTTPVGWTSLDNSAGSNFNGAVFTKILSGADIIAGNVVITFGGSYYGVVMGVTFVGALTGVRTSQAVRTGTGTTPQTVTTGGSPVSGDLALYFGCGRVNGVVTCDQGTITLQTSSGAEGSGAVKFGIVGASGAITANFAYTGSLSGTYQAVVVLQP